MYVTFKCLKCEFVNLVQVQNDAGSAASMRCVECGCEGRIKMVCPKCKSTSALVSVVSKYSECAKCQYKGAAEAFLFVLG